MSFLFPSPIFQFYSDDKADNVEVISTHSFHTLRVARYVRIMASTGVRWIGDDEKCFRFEILGCPIMDDDGNGVGSRFEPTMDFTWEALSSGFLQTSWMKPEVIIANRESIILDASHYAVDVVYKQDSSEITEEYNITNPGLIVANPLWGTEYEFQIFCGYQANLVHCGNHKIKAMMDRSTPDTCFSHVAGCRIQDRVQFVTPVDFKSVSLSNGSVLIDWQESLEGWRAPKMKLRITDGDILVESGENQNSILVPNLKEANNYELEFTPAGSGIPSEVKAFSATLILRKMNRK